MWTMYVITFGGIVVATILCLFAYHQRRGTQRQAEQWRKEVERDRQNLEEERRRLAAWMDGQRKAIDWAKQNAEEECRRLVAWMDGQRKAVESWAADVRVRLRPLCDIPREAVEESAQAGTELIRVLECVRGSDSAIILERAYVLNQRLQYLRSGLAAVHEFVTVGTVQGQPVPAAPHWSMTNFPGPQGHLSAQWHD